MVPEKDIETEEGIIDDFEGKNKMDDAELLEDKCGHLKKLMLAHILIVFVVSDYVQIIKFHRLYYLPFVLLMNLFSSVCVVSVWHDSLAWYSIALFLLFCHRWDICLAITSVIYSITTHI